MKKKLAGLLVTAVMLCGCLGLSAMAAKPNVELKSLQLIWGKNYAYDPILYYRNNTQKPIKYLEWYVTAYNRVGDSVPGDATKILTAVGPIPPFWVERTTGFPLYTRLEGKSDNPFKYYRETNYRLLVNEELLMVYQDAYGNFFVQPSNLMTATYLTEDEVQNSMFRDWCEFSDIGWYSTVLYKFVADKVVVTYMDGSVETITNLDAGTGDRSIVLKNPPFVQQLAQYQAVYNYQDYLTYNPDLAALYGADQKKLFDHFVTSGMKEGRRGSSEFDLNTYKANNPELVAMFGDDNVKYYEHYIASGKAEGRTAA